MSADMDRLAKVLGLLGSEHEGEIVAAARRAERVRRELGRSWAEILAPRVRLNEEEMRRLYEAGVAAGYARGIQEGREEAAANGAAASGPAWGLAIGDLWPSDPHRRAPHLGQQIERLDEVWRNRHRLSGWEAQFCQSVAAQICSRGRLSLKQIEILTRIHREKAP